MKLRMLLPCLALMAAMSPVLQADPASEDSVRELLALTEVSELVDQVGMQFGAMLDEQLAQIRRDPQLSAEQREILLGMHERMTQVVRQETDWAAYEAGVVQLYRENLTQSEIDSLLEMYRSPAGQLMLDKMPAITEATMMYVERQLPSMVERLQRIEREAIAELEQLP